MTDSNVNLDINADVSGLLDTLATAKDAIDATFGGAALTDSGIFTTMERSSDKAIASMMKGMENWHQAMGNVVRDVEIKFAQMGFNTLLSWIGTELGMTNATQAGNAARLASDEEAGSSGIASMAQRAVSSILNDASEVFGGIFAFLAPEMGPAAAGPAAAGSASVSALAGSILYAESGAWNIPSDTFAYLHAGEMVVPQSFASNLREGGGLGGGGDSYTIQINAIDTRSGAQFLKDNAGVIAASLSAQARNFNRNVPTWKG